MKTIYIHPVYPKTGTTYIQESILSNVNEIERIIEFNENRTSQGPYFEYFKSNFYKNTNNKFNNFYIDKKNFYDYLLKKITNSQNKKFILSDAGLLDPFGSPGTSNIYLLKDILKEIKLKESIDVKFLITIRSQAELIASYYAYRNHYFDDKTDLSLLLKNKKFMDNFKFSNLLNHIKDEFENSNILVLPLELLKKNSIDYFRKIEIFFDIKLSSDIYKNTEKINSNSKIIDNKKYFFINSYQENYLVSFLSKINLFFKQFKFYNKFISDSDFFLNLKNYFKKFNKKVIKSKIYLSSNHIEEIKDYFKNDNLEIEKKFSVNLNNLDYF